MKHSHLSQTVLSFIFILAFVLNTQAQDFNNDPKAEKYADTAHWIKSYEFGLNMNQASFSQNWKGGGLNSINIGGRYAGNLEYNSKILSWTSQLELLLGSAYAGEQGWRKTSDRIFFDTKLGYRWKKNWEPYLGANFLSQFDAGFDYGKKTRISGFLSPAYITQSLGIQYKPVEYFWVRFGLVTLRETIVNDVTLFDTTSKKEVYGVKYGEKVFIQPGLQIMAYFKKEIMKNIVLESREIFFMDYRETDKPEKWTNRLDLSITAKVNKYINTSLLFNTIYDTRQDAALQYANMIGLGVAYTYGK